MHSGPCRPVSPRHRLPAAFAGLRPIGLHGLHGLHGLLGPHGLHGLLGLAVVVLGGLLPACGGTEGSAAAKAADSRGHLSPPGERRPVPGASAGAIVDDFGARVALSLNPRRVVSLNPTTTEIMFTIGARDRLIGRSRWDRWPVAALAVPDLGDALQPNVESVLAARPDLVVLYASPANRTAADALGRAGIRTLTLRVDTVREFERATRILGALLDHRAQADSVADSVRATLQLVRDRTARLEHPTAVWELSSRPPIVAGGGSFMSELLDIAGARNLYGFVRDPSPAVAVEDVIARDPDVLITGGDGGDVTPRGSWSLVPAVRRGRVIALPAALVARPSVQMGMAAAALARALHPGVVIK